MLNYPLGEVAMQVTKVSDMGGRVTADKIGSGSRAGRRNESLRCLARYSLLGTAMALLPMTQAVAGVAAQFVPLQVSTIPANGDTNPYGVASVPFGFPRGDHSARVISWFPTSITLAVSRGPEPRSLE